MQRLQGLLITYTKFYIPGFSHYNWSELQKASLGDKELAEETGITLVDGTPLTPQQLGIMIKFCDLVTIICNYQLLF
jgi:hypothetical protein